MTDFQFGEPVPEHPAADQVAAYIENKLSPADRHAMEGHLADCRECRQDVTSAQRLVRQRRQPRRKAWAVPAAAAAVFVVFVLSRTLTDSRSDEAVRSTTGAGLSDTVVAIEVVSPADRATIADAVVFAWKGQSDRPLYKITVTEGTGRTVWSAETSDTVVTLPQTITLERGKMYFWVVDALAADGRSRTTRTHRFSAAP